MSDIRSFFGGSSAPSKKAATPPPKKGGGSPAKKGGAAGSQGSPAKLPAKPKAAPAPKPATAPAFKAAAPAPKAADDDDLMEIDTADFFGGGKATPKVLAARAATSPAMIKVEAGEQPKSASKRERKLPVAEPPAKMPCLSPHPAATSEPAAAASGAVGGARECLRSCVLVFTGEFPEIGSREAAEDYAKEWGGKVTSAVSGRTTYLVRGHDHGDPGKLQEGTKVSEAESKGVPTLSEQQLLALVRDAASGKLPERVRDAQKKSDEASAKAIKAAGKAAAKLPSPPRRSATAAGKQPAGGAAPAAPRGEREPSSLWTDIYAPKSFDELVGNQAAAKKLQEWLREFAAGRCKPNERAALLSVRRLPRGPRLYVGSGLAVMPPPLPHP
ncbi:hypothetical protein T492DRAFT_1149706 [Pavlovales sp. CCMP2436]|nr:hypothetical protein T492DRAFT_1149706 [Pavlovales sp. CCMP2436]